MFRFLLAVAAVAVLLLPTFILPESVSARRRCEEKLPETLLSLYRGSSTIYIGRFDKSVDGEVSEEHEDYSVVKIKKHFNISSTLKGESRKMFVLDEDEYRYKNQEEAAETEEHGEMDGPAELKNGDLVLLFLKKNEESTALELTDYRDAVKKVTTDSVGLYEARINDLNTIFGGAKPKYSQIVEWLIRCAENPETRWEGTFELLQSFERLEWDEERAKLKKEKTEAGDNSEDEYEVEDLEEFATGDVNFAKNLNANQKQVLSNLLLNRDPAPKSESNAEEKTSLANGDRELIELVKRWGDPRLAHFLFDQLRNNASEPYLNSQMMTMLAAVLNDGELLRIAEEYSNNQWESDDAAIEDPAATPEPVTEGSETSSESAADQQGDKSSSSDAEVETAEPKKAKKLTYGELRSKLMSEFLARGEKVIKKEDEKAVAKSMH